MSMLLALFLLVQALVGSTCVEAANGLVSRNGKYYYYVNSQPVKNRWMTVYIPVNGNYVVRRFYFSSNGSACTGAVTINGSIYIFNNQGALVRSSVNRLFAIDGNVYCPDQNGKAQTNCWLLVNNHLYYAQRNGVIARNMTYQGITIRNGVAQAGLARNLKILCLSLLGQGTKNSDTSLRKLLASWAFLMNRNRFRYVDMALPNFNNRYWAKSNAYSMLLTRKGDAFGFACAFAALASACGYQPYVIVGKVYSSEDVSLDHCWVRIGSRYFDPEGQFSGWNIGTTFGATTYTPPATSVKRVILFETGALQPFAN